MKSEMRHLVPKIVFSFLIAFLFSGCAKDTSSPAGSGRYWNVVMAGTSIATITFGNSVSPLRDGIIEGGWSTSFHDTVANRNLYILGGSSACQIGVGGSVVVPPGDQSGTIKFSGICAGTMTSDMQIILGNSVAAVFDSKNNYIVEAGRSVVGTIVAPGTTGASTGDISY